MHRPIGLYTEPLARDPFFSALAQTGDYIPWEQGGRSLLYTSPATFFAALSFFTLKTRGKHGLRHEYQRNYLEQNAAAKRIWEVYRQHPAPFWLEKLATARAGWPPAMIEFEAGFLARYIARVGVNLSPVIDNMVGYLEALAAQPSQPYDSLAIRHGGFPVRELERRRHSVLFGTDCGLTFLEAIDVSFVLRRCKGDLARTADICRYASPEQIKAVGYRQVFSCLPPDGPFSLRFYGLALSLMGYKNRGKKAAPLEPRATALWMRYYCSKSLWHSFVMAERVDEERLTAAGRFRRQAAPGVSWQEFNF